MRHAISALVVLVFAAGMAWAVLRPVTAHQQTSTPTLAETLSFNDAVPSVAADPSWLNEQIPSGVRSRNYVGVVVYAQNTYSEPVEVFLEDEFRLRDGSGNLYRYHETASALLYATDGVPLAAATHTKDLQDARWWNPGVGRVVFFAFAVPTDVSGPFVLVSRDGSVELAVR